MAGTSGQSLRLEAIQIRIVKVNNPTVEYCGHIEMDGWEQTYSRSNGQTSGKVRENSIIKKLWNPPL